ncbi:hypothetical protein [Sulfurimonas sp.]|uniref:hypothetical protein n=1 Tax=Sulfurimonas sp. TaxID=2022749 RepID=UPI002AB1E640|nr:hypothetical protein [Sulfurimonas sp.]
MEILVYLLVALPFIVITIIYIFAKNTKCYLKYPTIILGGWIGFRIQLFVLLSYINDPSVLITKVIELEKLYINVASWIPTLIFLVVLQITNMIYRLIKFTIESKASNKTQEPI